MTRKVSTVQFRAILFISEREREENVTLTDSMGRAVAVVVTGSSRGAVQWLALRRKCSAVKGRAKRENVKCARIRELK
ncbi:hypothetical protein TSUD_125870 [Trifolium subterraneum]|uniref:Uncharacterized protein n=1 Tax=Trifolium subterraneum TaxID=3900 RepID=A0A2Z6M6H8_TRISU|nr:hypothetical protein TSUD_125870 [Trifolium subterraneum]